MWAYTMVFHLTILDYSIAKPKCFYIFAGLLFAVFNKVQMHTKPLSQNQKRQHGV
jgi:hypothetical protein